MPITSIFIIGPFVPCIPLCKILNMPVMSICLVKQNDGTWVEKQQRFYSTFTNVFFIFLSRFLRFLTCFIFFLKRFFTSMISRGKATGRGSGGKATGRGSGDKATGRGSGDKAENIRKN